MFSLRKDAKDVCPARSLRRNELRCQALAARTTLTWMTGQHGRAKQACIPRGAQDGAQALAPGLAAAINALPEMPLGRANWEHPNLMMCVMSFLDTLEVEDRKEAKHCCSAFRRNWSRSFLETVMSSQDMHTNIAHALVAEVKARELDR